VLRSFREEPHHTKTLAQTPPIARLLDDACARGESLVPVLQRIVVSLGFEHFMYAVSTSPQPTQQTRGYVWTSLPSEWVQLYDAHAYIEVDPRLSSAWTSMLPVVWDQSTFPSDPRVQAFFAAAAEFGVCSGVVFALRTRFEAPGVFTLSSSVRDVDHERSRHVANILSDVMALGMHVHDLFLASVVGQVLPAPSEGRPLSQRERQCLQLAARGRNSREIGAELHIGERTVHTHFSNLLAKLGASNRHEAIAMASQAGLISV
jgi:DNA-binding CsgD family transcriptional regulator